MASSSHQQAYDVFVSFRYEDISKTFMDHLFSDLKRKGIHAYMDNNQLTRGEESSFEAIEQSRVIIVIFSHNYASSTLCLKELVKILECKKSKNDKYEVWPIFYDVTPAVVRNQRGSYEEAIMTYEASNEKEVIKWKKALMSAGNLSGWDLQNTTNGYESKFIDIILKEIFNKLIDGPIPSGDSLVGLYARAEQMNLSQFAGSDKVHTIGICGIGGIGKTSVAKAIYNLMYKHFEACSFCEDVKDVVNRNGLVHLQTKLLDDILNDGDPLTDIKIPSVGEGVCIMKRRMKGKKVFIVLDDVDSQNQFEALVGNPDWFNPGSLIVVTSRDRQLLKANHVEHVYEIDPLNDDEACELFHKYSFKNEHPPDEFNECANRILNYVNGHPLALKTIGSSLFNKTLREWEHEIDSLQSSPNALIHQVLKVSYNGLDADQKNIFLDIACFFRGEKKDYVLKILDVCESSFSTNLRVLVDKSLINICGDRIQMHNLVQQMGRQIIREESEEPAKRSRLWSSTDVLDVLKNDKGTEFVKGLALDLSSSKVNIDGQSFTKLKNLRLLHIYIGDLSSCRDTNGLKCRRELWKETNVSVASGKLEFLSNELQLLCWHGYPFQHLPSSFFPDSLLVLDLSFSCIKQIWSGSKGFKNLTLLNLSHCQNLRKTPDFTETPNIKELILAGCENLVKVHPSIGTLKTLIILDIKNCKNLEILPNITKLESLENLNLSGCSKIKNLVKSHPLRLSSCIRKFHEKFDRTSVLHSLSTIGSLRVLNVSHCNLLGASVSSLESLCSLEELDMSGNDFTSVNADLSRLSRLSCLRLTGCKKLQVLPNLPSSVLKLDVQHCISLQELPRLLTMYNGGTAVFDFRNCRKVVENRTVESLLMEFLPQGRIDIFEEVNIFLPGSSIPGWFSNQCDSDTITMELPSHWQYKRLKGLATCVVITPENTSNKSTYFEISCSVKNLHGDLVSDVSLLSTDDPNIESDQIWVWYKRSDPRWMKVDDRFMVSFKCVGINCKVKRCGVRLVVEDEAAVAIEDEQ